MPPTPFHPTHQTPFKSTVSTSQQSRLHHTPFESQASAQLSIADIDPSEWRYHAEGGKNVLLSFSPATGVTPGLSPFVTPTCTYALRIPKSHPTENSEDQHQADAFTEHVVAPLLGDASVLPTCIKIPITSASDRHIIDTLAARIEMQRPAARRAHPARIRAETLSCIYAVQDLTAPTSSSRGVLCVEIKPKWGFLPRIDALPPSSPNVEIKAKYSRYRMHRVQRQPDMPKQRFEQLYDPLDLYSTDEQRKAKAVKALWEDWNESAGKTNNLRLFWNGQLVSPGDARTLDAVAHFLGAEPGQQALLEVLTKLLVTELSKPTLPGSAADATRMSVLSRLAVLQSRLDPLDVEGLAQLWLHHTQSHTLGQTHANTPDLPLALTAALAPADLLPVLAPFLASSSPAEHDGKLEDAVQAFLVAASFKDCSLLLRFARTEHGLDAQTKLVDLDPKPFAKLAAMQSTDADVCAAFLAWLATLPSAPAASIAA